MHRREAESQLARVERENQELRRRLDQMERHRNRPLLRELEANLDALEAVGVDGWPKTDEGRSSGHSSGSRGDKQAVARLVHTENVIRSLNESASEWLDHRQEQHIHGLEVA
jgi:hypothetical protein